MKLPPEPCRVSAGHLKRGRTLLGILCFVRERLEEVLVAARLGRVVHRIGRRALVAGVVPPDRAAFLLRLALLGMLLEVLAHEFGQLGFVHGAYFWGLAAFCCSLRSSFLSRTSDLPISMTRESG